MCFDTKLYGIQKTVSFTSSVFSFIYFYFSNFLVLSSSSLNIEITDLKEAVKTVAAKLDGPVVVVKGETDLVSDGNSLIYF